MININELVRLGLVNIAPRANDKDLQVLNVSVTMLRDAEGKPTAEVESVGIICLGHGTAQPVIKILRPSAEIISRANDLKAKLESGLYIRASFENLVLKPYVIYSSNNAGVSCKATDFSITVEKNLDDELELEEIEL